MPDVISPYRVVDRIPLNSAQMWWQWTHQPIFALNFRLRLEMPLELEPFQKAWQHVVESEPVLRTIFPGGERSAEQVVIAPAEPFPVQCQDLSHMDAADRENAIRAWVRERNRTLDLATWPLLQVMLFREGPAAFELVIIYPLYIGDMVGLKVLLRKVLMTYRTLMLGGKPQTGARQDRYQDYAEYLDGLDPAVVACFRSEWSQSLPPSGFAIPHDYQKGPNSYESERCHNVYWPLPVDKLQGSAEAQRSVGIYWYIWLALSRTLAEWTGQKRVVICERAVGRDLPMPKNLFKSLGFYVVDHPVPIAVEPGEPLARQLAQTEAWLSGAGLRGAVYNHLVGQFPGEVPLPHLVSPIRIDFGGRADAESALPGVAFRSGLGRLAIEQGEIDLNYGFENVAESMRHEIGQRDRLYQLDITCAIWDATLVMGISYSNHLHSSRTIQQLGGSFLRHLDAIADEGHKAGYHCVF